jgi:hypothetical protein
VRSWSTLVVPVFAAAILALTVQGGSALFGWTA